MSPTTACLIFCHVLAATVIALIGFNFAALQRRKLKAQRCFKFSEDRRLAVKLSVGQLRAPWLLAKIGFNSGWLWPWSEKARKEAGLQ